MRLKGAEGGPSVFSAKNLVRIRKERKLSQEGVARRSGLATVTVSKLEEGKTSDPRMSTVRKLAKALGCSVEVLFSEDSQAGRNGGRV